jgi:hypothetical protein
MFLLPVRLQNTSQQLGAQDFMRYRWPAITLPTAGRKE